MDSEEDEDNSLTSYGQNSLGGAATTISRRLLSQTTSIPKQIEKISHSIPQKIEKIAHLAWNAVSFDALPEWLRDNEYLKCHHRPPMYSITGCIKSIFRMHTETWNIWTHLIGFMFFVVLTAGIYLYRDYITQLFEDKVIITDLPWQDQFVLLSFFLSAMTCLFCSAIFHMLGNHSEKAYQLLSKLDYTGIAILITGSGIAPIYYCFYCAIISRYTYLSILIVLCAACIVVSLWDQFNKPKYRPLRFIVFVLFGLYGVVPMSHLMITEGLIKPYTNYIIGLILMGVIYIMGAALYVLRIPERFFPGRFDVWAHSHQWFHICVVAAVLVHYDTLLSMIRDRLDMGDCIAVLVNGVSPF